MATAERSVVAAIVLVLGVVLISGCSGATLVPITPPPATPTPEPTPTPTPTPTQTPEPGETAAPTPAPPVEVALTIDTATGPEDFKFTTDTLTAPSNSIITLTLNNKTNPDDEIGHNWVLVKPGQEESVLANGLAAGDDKDWLDTDDPGIIAATRLIEGDEKNAVTFDSPEPGRYSFLCTFPEHFQGGMKGTLTIS